VGDVSRFSPSAGLWVDINGGTVSITGAMEMYGEEGSAANAKSVQDSINKTWTRNFPDGFIVQTNITVTYRGSSSAGNATQIEACKMSGPSNVRPAWGGRKMTLNANEADAFTWTAAHEFGHVIGLDDRYEEGFVSKVKGTFGGQRDTKVTPGYDGNIMAVDQGVLESKNVSDIAAENNPSSWWINDDDHVRDWINSHGGPDISRLSTETKLKSIRTLMSGWISGDDMKAIRKIMANVKDKKEADAIRKGIDPLDFTSIGQRTEFRVAASQMP
jgi:hypothetical protein